MRAFERLRPRNPGTKLVALALTLLVSGFVYLDQEHEAIVSVPLEIADVPSDRVPLDELPSHVSVRIVARGRRLAKMWLTRSRLDDLAVIVRVPEGFEAVDRVLSPVDVSVPLGTGVRVSDIVDPDRVSFRLDHLAVRELPVAPRLAGSPPRGYLVSGEVRVTPPVATVQGPATLVDPLGEIRTEPVLLENRRGPFNASVALALPPRIKATPQFVQVHADVEPERQQRIDSVRVVVRNARTLVPTVDPPIGSVTLLGPASRVDRLAEIARSGEPTGLVIAVDASGKGPGTYEVTPVVELTDALRLVAVEPSRVLMRLRERPGAGAEADR